MKFRGQITVFLSLILLCMFSLICSLIESARLAGARCYLEMAAYSALDSVMSQYHLPLWEEYRVLGVEYTEKQAIEEEFGRYLNEYLNMPNWYAMTLNSVETKELIHLTDNGGNYLEQQILDFMKYGIWTLDVDQNGIEAFNQTVKEAKQVNEVSKKMEGQTKEAWKLERTLEKIAECLKAQENSCQEAEEALERRDGSGFLKAARELQKSLGKIPGFVENYSRQADKLAKKMEEVRREYEEKRQNMGDSVQQIMLEQLSRYDAYVSKDGERRQEVEKLPQLAGEQEELVSKVMEEAEEVMEYIESWEPEQEGEVLDEGELWEGVRSHFAQYRVLKVSYAAGGKDKESEGLLNQIRRAAESGIVQLVLPEGARVSDGMVEAAGLPSKNQADSGAKGPDGIKRLTDKALTAEYVEQFFTDFCDQSQKEFQYEMEYILYGSPIDGSNLSSSIAQLLAVREGLNLIHILTNSQKRQEAEALAAAIVGVSGFAPLIGITSFFIMGIWALGEALTDVKQLLSGGKVPIRKEADEWALDLDGLLQLGKSGRVPQKQGGEGLDYTGYLKLFFMAAPAKMMSYRMMDMMQVNIARKEPGFSMSKCASQVEIEAGICGKHVFLSLGLLKSFTEQEAGKYENRAVVKKAY